MKIGFVLDDSLDREDGVQQYIKTLGRWLIESGHDVRYLVGDTHEAGDLQPFVHSLARNVDVRFNKNRLTIPLPASNKKITETLNREKFDVLHVQAPYSPMLGSKVINKAPDYTGVVASFHIVGSSWRENYGLKALKIWQSRSLKRIDEYLAVSPAALEASKQYFPALPHVSPNVVNNSAFYPAAGTKSTVKKIIFLGRLVERKGVHHLLEALNILKNRSWFKEVKVEIGSNGPDYEKLVEKTLEYGLEEQVKFIGFVEVEEKAAFYQQAELAVFPSTGGESFGIVLVEAIAAGALVLAGDNEGYRTVLSGPKEMIVDPNDHKALANSIELLLNDDLVAKKVRHWQKDRIKDFDVRRVGPEILKHYRAAQRHRISLSSN